MERSKIIKEELSDYEGKMFLHYQQCDGQAVIEMVEQTREIFAKFSVIGLLISTNVAAISVTLLFMSITSFCLFNALLIVSETFNYVIIQLFIRISVCCHTVQHISSSCILSIKFYHSAKNISRKDKIKDWHYMKFMDLKSKKRGDYIIKVQYGKQE